MYQSLQQAQQLISTIDQMASQMRQQESSNRQMLGQLEQRESQATQRLQQIQQMCQECGRVLQNHQTAYHQNNFATMPMQGFQQEFSSPISFGGMGTFQSSGVNLGQPQNVGAMLQTQVPLVDPTTMGASTYYDSMRQFGGQSQQNLYTPGGAAGLQSSFPGSGTQSGMGMGTGFSSFSGGSFQSSGVNLGQPQNVGSFMQTQSSLVDPTTMGASTYTDSLRQFGGQSNQNLYNSTGIPNMQAGASFGSMGQGGVFSTQGIPSFTAQGSSSGMNMEIASLPTNTPFASLATMGPSKYESAAQNLSGTSMSTSTMGQQSGIAAQ